MPVERVYATIYYVDDWEASVAFYRDVIGLKPVHVEKGWAEFEVGGTRIALHARHPGDAADVTHVSLQVRDIDATLRAMERGGARVVEVIRREAFGAIAAVADPSGNVIGLYEPR
jgi:predicted enzyme related to lactoylglutathione lyase